MVMVKQDGVVVKMIYLM